MTHFNPADMNQYMRHSARYRSKVFRLVFRNLGRGLKHISRVLVMMT